MNEIPSRFHYRVIIFSKEQLELALRKKRECNAKALKVVEELIEQRIDHVSFIEKVVKFISSTKVTS